MLRLALLALVCGCASGANSARVAYTNCAYSESAARSRLASLEAERDRSADDVARCDATLVVGIETTDGAVRCAEAHERDRQLAWQVYYARQQATGGSCEGIGAMANAEEDARHRRAEAIGTALQGVGDGLSAAGRPAARPVSCSSLVVGPTIQTNCY